jgi:integrase
MIKKPPKYIHGFNDRLGRPKFYFRRPGFKQVRLPGLPWSPQFMAAYEAAMNGEPLPKIGIPGKTQPGTMSDLIERYYRASDEFANLKPSTKVSYRRVIEHIRTEHGHRAVAGLKRAKLKAMLAHRADKPAAANEWLKRFRALMRFAVDNEMRLDDPTVGISLLTRNATGPSGARCWKAEQLERYRSVYAIGTCERLNLELLYGTSARISDIARLGRQHIRDGRIVFIPQKTERRKAGPIVVSIPILPELQEALDAMPRGNLTFLVWGAGRPYSAKGLGNWFREACDEAGIPRGYSSHGLRKAATVRLWHAGCSLAEIMAVGGWTSPKQIMVYVEEADRELGADNAMKKIKSGTSSGKL